MATNEEGNARLRGFLEEAFMAAEERRLNAEEFLAREYAEADRERVRAASIWNMARLGELPVYQPTRKVVRSA